MSRFLSASLACLALCAPSFAGTTYFVNAATTTGANDGSSWANAFQTSDGLQAALALTVGSDTVFVAQGTYLATQGANRGTSFALQRRVQIFGGFLGTEATVTERPAPGSAPSILSGDLAGNDGSGLIGENTFHVVRTSGTDKTAVLDGFDVVGGNANSAGSNNDRGGGILCAGNVSPTIRNVRFIGNRSSFGGAAGYVNNGGAPSFTDCSFIDGVGGSFGGAFDIAGGGQVILERCLFSGNRANRAGALEIFASSSSIVVNNCVFIGNTATGGSGGGAIWVGSGGNTQIRNCTIVGNSATNQAVGGIRNQGAGGTTVRNCVVWGNSGSGGAMASANQATANLNMTFSIVMGGFAGAGNLAVDPGFEDLAGGDLSLGAGSPAIDAGDNGALIAGADFDLAGNPRLVDDPAVADTGVGPGPIVDMGAFEGQVPAGPFASTPGCGGNAAVLAATTPTFALNAALGFTSTSPGIMTGATAFYIGVSGVDAGGCGVPLAPFGEALLSLSITPMSLGIVPFNTGQSVFAGVVPGFPELVGLELSFQTFTVDTTPLGAPSQLSNMLTGTVQP